MVHLALQLSMVVAGLRPQHLVDLNPWCIRLWQAQAPEADVAGALLFSPCSCSWKAAADCAACCRCYRQEQQAACLLQQRQQQLSSALRQHLIQKNL